MRNLRKACSVKAAVRPRVVVGIAPSRTSMVSVLSSRPSSSAAARFVINALSANAAASRASVTGPRDWTVMTMPPADGPA